MGSERGTIVAAACRLRRVQRVNLALEAVHDADALHGLDGLRNGARKSDVEGEGVVPWRELENGVLGVDAGERGGAEPDVCVVADGSAAAEVVEKLAAAEVAGQDGEALGGCGGGRGRRRLRRRHGGRGRNCPRVDDPSLRGREQVVPRAVEHVHAVEKRAGGDDLAVAGLEVLHKVDVVGAAEVERDGRDARCCKQAEHNLPGDGDRVGLVWRALHEDHVLVCGVQPHVLVRRRAAVSPRRRSGRRRRPGRRLVLEVERQRRARPEHRFGLKLQRYLVSHTPTNRCQAVVSRRGCSSGGKTGLAQLYIYTYIWLTRTHVIRTAQRPIQRHTRQ